MRYKLTIAYDGTHYAGWQVQKNGQAIQPLIQRALAVVLRHPLGLTGSSRTDAGVHAEGQTAHFDTEVAVIPGKLLLSLNALLPPDIRILQIDPVPEDFHARYSAKSKVYRYHLHLSPISDPFTKLYCHQVFGRFDLDLLKQGANEFLGTHDFTSFANTKEDILHAGSFLNFESHHGGPSLSYRSSPILRTFGPPRDNSNLDHPETPKIQASTRAQYKKPGIRTIYRIDAIEQKEGVLLEFEGNGFLYKMVRNIVGTLLEVAAGKSEPHEIRAILASRNRRKAGATAPAKGLFLAQVRY